MQTKLPFFKKLLAVALFFVAIFCCKAFAVSVTAEESTSTPQTAATTDEYTVLAKGTCGTNLTWQLTSDYTLTISGTGKTYDFSSTGAPWENYRESIKKIDIGAEVTSIDGHAFSNCTGLASVTIGNSVTSIGYEAFCGCNNLTSVNYTGTIDQWVQIKFGNSYGNPLCYAKNLYINNRLVTAANITLATNINAYAFSGYSGLTSVTIPDSVTSIGDHVFHWIKEIPATCTQTGKLGYYYCSACNNYLDKNENVIGNTETDLVIPAKGHAYGDWIKEIPATCTEYGVLGHYHCSECQNNFDNKKQLLLTIVIEKTEHNYKNKQTYPTCTEDGKIEYTCQNCQDKKVEIIAATGHKYGAWQDDVKPSCDQEGSKHRNCTACDNSEIAKVLPLKHKFELQADLSTSVKDVYICKLCKVQKDVPKDGKLYLERE